MAGPTSRGARFEPPGRWAHCEAVTIVLRHAETGLYYAGRRSWVVDPAAAAEFGTIARAGAACPKECLGRVNGVVIYVCERKEVVLPLGRKKAG